MRPVPTLLFVIVLAVVTAQALDPNPLVGAPGDWDKALHALAFAVLTGLLLACWHPRERRHALVSAAFLLTWGGLIEWAQHFLPTRQAEFADWLADAMGVAVALTLGLLISRSRRWRRV